MRIAIEPSGVNGLDQASQLMVDKVTTVHRGNLGQRLGRLRETEIVQLNRALVVSLGLAAG